MLRTILGLKTLTPAKCQRPWGSHGGAALGTGALGTQQASVVWSDQVALSDGRLDDDGCVEFEVHPRPPRPI